VRFFPNFDYPNALSSKHREQTLAELTSRELTLAKWEKYTRWPLIIAAIIFLITYAVPIIWPGTPFFLVEIDIDIFTVVWSAFIVDYLMRLGLSTNRARFIRHNLLDLLSLVLPIFRPLRVLRVLVAVTTLGRIGRSSLRRQVMIYTIGMVSTITLVSALAATSAERGVANSSIHSFGDGIWWAFVTLTTVGYGDMSPVTTVGRIVGVILMVSGVLLLGVISASLASWLVEHSGNANTEITKNQAQDISSLEANVAKLSSDVERLTNYLATAQITAGPDSQKTLHDLTITTEDTTPITTTVTTSSSNQGNTLGIKRHSRKGSIR